METAVARPPTAGELLRGVLPQRDPLAAPLWRARHRALLALLVLHVVVLLPWAALNGHAVDHVVAPAAGLGLLAAVAALARSRTLAASCTSVGLVAAAAVVVHAGQGRTVLHFHFFVVVAALALYRQWLPFGLAVGFVLVDHAAMGLLAPEDLYDDAFSLGSPWAATLLHGGYVLAAAASSALAWTWAERERRSAELRAEQEAARVRDSEGRLTALLDHMPASVFVKDLDGRFVSVNREMERLLDRGASDALGSTSGTLFADADLELVEGHDAEVVATGRASERQELQRLLGVDHVFSVVKFPLLDDSGAVTAVAGIATDVTERVVAQRALRESEARLRQVFAHGPVAQVVLQLDGTLLEVNPAFTALLGYQERELVGMRMQTLVLPADRERCSTTLFPGGSVEGASRRLELRLVTRDGERLSCLVSVARVAVGDGPGYGVGMVEDVTAARRGAAELAHQATHDALTGLPNRVLLLERLAEALAQDGQSAAVLFLDLDGFKEVNDGLGHDAGDLLLHDVARRLDGVRRDSDTLARLGGDEFVLCCPGLDVHAAAEVAQRMLGVLRVATVVADRVVEVRGSIGVAGGRADDGTSPMLLLRDADTALYAAKAAGRDRVVLFTPELRERDERRRRLQADLAAALRHGGAGLLLEYQPVADVETGALVGCEALVRWDHPDDGRLAPGEFLPLAQDKGLLPALDRWVLDTACRAAAAWTGPAGPPSVAVNLTPQTLAGDDVVEWVAEACAVSGLAPSRLVVELTETAVLERPLETSRTLSRLRATGVRVALDDFGTGWSSMSHLRDLPVDIIKIDRSFTVGAADSLRDRAIVRATADLAAALGAMLVAEGVETTDQRAAVVAAGCRLLQGWHVSRPLPEAEVAPLLARAVPPAPRLPLDATVRSLRR